VTFNSNDLVIEVDLDAVRKAGDRVRTCLLRLRREFDLTPFEYTRRVRIAPLEIPHSHPVLTLNTRTEDDHALLCTYVHEQMHWYLWRLGSPSLDPISPFYGELKERYPDAPMGFPEGANDEYSTYLHLVVNWLEVEAASTLLGRDRATAIALATPVYRWIYRQVIADWDSLGKLYLEHNILPIRPASEFSDEILAELNDSRH